MLQLVASTVVVFVVVVFVSSVDGGGCFGGLRVSPTPYSIVFSRAFCISCSGNR